MHGLTRRTIEAGLGAVAWMAVASAPSWAADASHPYSSVDHSVDAGNDTGDSQTDQLNQRELRRVSPDSEAGNHRSGARGSEGDRGWNGTAYGHAGYAPPPAGYVAPGPYPPPYAYYPPAYAYPAPYPIWRPWWRPFGWYRPWCCRAYYRW